MPLNNAVFLILRARREKAISIRFALEETYFKYKSGKMPLNNAVFLILHASRREKAISRRFALEETY
jgi:hypothetical protein